MNVVGRKQSKNQETTGEKKSGKINEEKLNPSAINGKRRC